MGKTRHSFYALAAVFVALLVLIAAPFCGSRFISLSEVFADGVDSTIFWQLRMPRVLLAFVAGALLSLGGMAFQTLFRNALATPYSLGVSGGAALAVSIAVRFGVAGSVIGIGINSVSAFVGALIASAVVFGISRMRRGAVNGEMLLAGVAVSILCSNAIMFIQYTGNEDKLFQTMRWMLGGVAVTGYGQVSALAILCLIPAGIILFYAREMDLLEFGDTFASSRGVNVMRCAIIIFICVSFMVGAVVAVCGPIGFIGMICPHICRRLFGTLHRTLVPSSLVFGGVFLVACDVVGRSVAAPAEIPVGIVTGLIGCPFFLWLLYSQRNS